MVGGVSISHPDRVMYPDIGLTKVELARYYEDVAEVAAALHGAPPAHPGALPGGLHRRVLLSETRDRRVCRSIVRVPVKEDGGSGVYVAVDSLAGILSLVQVGALEFHVWGSHLETLEQPDQMVFDLDPAEDLPFGRVNEAARILHDLLDGLGLASFVKTSGGKGLHVVVPLDPAGGWDEVKDFSRALAEAMVAADPRVSSPTCRSRSGPARPSSTFCATAAAPRSSCRTARAVGRRAGERAAALGRAHERPARRPLRGGQRAPASGRPLEADPWEGYAAVRQQHHAGHAARGRSGRRHKRGKAA